MDAGMLPTGKPPFPQDVRACLDPQLFICDTCGVDLEYPATLCRDCRRQRDRHKTHRGGRGFPSTAELVRIPRDELHEFKALFGIPTEALVQVPVMRMDPCAYCGAPGPNTLDHVQPLSASTSGVSNWWNNATACCQRCNALKGSMPLFEFLSKREQLDRSHGPVHVGRRAARDEQRRIRQWERYYKRQQAVST